MATIVGPLTDTFRAAQRGPHPESVAVSTVNLGTSQTANEDSTNTADRGNLTSGGFLRLASTLGPPPASPGRDALHVRYHGYHDHDGRNEPLPAPVGPGVEVHQARLFGQHQRHHHGRRVVPGSLAR